MVGSLSVSFSPPRPSTGVFHSLDSLFVVRRFGSASSCDLTSRPSLTLYLRWPPPFSSEHNSYASFISTAACVVQRVLLYLSDGPYATRWPLVWLVVALWEDVERREPVLVHVRSSHYLRTDMARTMRSDEARVLSHPCPLRHPQLSSADGRNCLWLPAGTAHLPHCRIKFVLLLPLLPCSRSPLSTCPPNLSSSLLFWISLHNIWLDVWLLCAIG